MSGKTAKKQRQLDRQHRVFWGSSYDRGLDILLFMWPDVMKQYPDAELHICYGWNLFDKANSNNPERMQWKASVESMMNQPGVIHHGRIGKKELARVRKACGVWAYPTYFTEINCITALEAQHDGLVPVTMDYAALSETVGSGYKIEGDIRTIDVQEKFLEALLTVMGDTAIWEKESTKASEFAKNYTWDKIALKWNGVLKEKEPMPLVSVITVTIRPGFWNVMADNLSKQTYKKFEWIIVDDYKEDRSRIAQKYAEKYNLNIRYIRGDKVLGKYHRRYGLVRANNTGWKNAKGELLVWLQDFILIPEHGIEDLVTLYNHNPNALLAPTDDFFHCIKPDKKNTEDWFNGKIDILTGHSWRNIRTANEGIRKTDNPYDYEMNYGATPKKIIEKLNGFWEFFDNGLGFDNSELAFRALESGYEIIIDDTNVATCIDLWPHIGGTVDNITDRDRNLGLPYWFWMKQQIMENKMPLVRDEKLDSTIDFNFSVPKDIPDEKAAEWIQKNTEKIMEGFK